MVGQAEQGPATPDIQQLYAIIVWKAGLDTLPRVVPGFVRVGLCENDTMMQLFLGIIAAYCTIMWCA